MHQFCVAADIDDTLTFVYIVNGETSKYYKHYPNSFIFKFNNIREEYLNPNAYSDSVFGNFIKKINITHF